MEASGQFHAPVALPPGNEPTTYRIGGWVGPRACLDGLEKIKLHCLCRDSKTGSCHLSLVTAPTALSGLLVKYECSCLHFFTPIHLQCEQGDSIIQYALYHSRLFSPETFLPTSISRILLVSLVAMCAQISVK